MKKKLFAAILASLVIIVGATGCGEKDSSQGSTPAEPVSSSACPVCSTTIDDVNEFLNDSETMHMDNANVVAVIPFTHINGPKNEWDFYAFVNFQYKEKKYVKYQVTYLSCTCRAANVNYWQTAYVELTLPGTNETAEDTKLQKLSFDADGTNHYTAGFWGDSSPIYDEATGAEVIATYEKTSDGNGGYYPSIKEEFIPLLIGLTKTQIDAYSTIDDMTDKVGTTDIADYFMGASVSTNNILRILHSLFEYHADTFCTAA